MTEVPVRVVDLDAFDAWRAELPNGAGFQAAAKDKIAATGETLLCWFGSEPAGGWDAPRWANSRTLERPTLAPSLGCGNWRRGECVGHWRLRDGVLVTA